MFNCFEKTFSHRIIPTITFSTHSLLFFIERKKGSFSKVGIKSKSCGIYWLHKNSCKYVKEKIYISNPSELSSKGFYFSIERFRWSVCTSIIKIVENIFIMYRHRPSNCIKLLKAACLTFSSHLANRISAVVLSFVLLNIQDRFWHNLYAFFKSG